MKKTTLSKIFGVAVVIALLASLIIAAVPTSAITYSGAGVTVTPATISAAAVYDIKFTGSFALNAGDIVAVVFPSGTVLPAATDGVTAEFSNGVLALAPATSYCLKAANTVYVVATAADVGRIWNIVFTAGIANPGTPGSYALSISTYSPGAGLPALGPPKEGSASSPSYTISTPVQASVYNAAGNFLGTFMSFQDALDTLPTGGTVKLGPGTYKERAETNGTALKNVVITSTSSAADTIIQPPDGPGDGVALEIIGADTYVTVSNLTIKGQLLISNGSNHDTVSGCTFTKANPGADESLLVDEATDAIIKNCSFDTTMGSTADVAIGLDTAGGTPPFGTQITNCTFKLNQSNSLEPDVAIDAWTADVFFTANGCTFTGPGLGYWNNLDANATIQNSTFTGLQNAVLIDEDSSLKFTGNTVDQTIAAADPTQDGAILITAAPTVGTNTVAIYGNIIKNSVGHSVQITATSDALTITGNSFSGNAKGFLAAAPVAPILNWWGSAGGPNATGSDIIDADSVIGPPNYTPWLGAPTAAANATFSKALDAVVNDPFDFTAPGGSGIYISNVTIKQGSLVTGMKLAANPTTLTPPYPTSAYFDVYMGNIPNTSAIQINFYGTGITNASQLYFYSGAAGNWVLCSNQAVAGTGAYAYVIINGTSTPAFNDLKATYFALVQGLPPAPANFAVESPALGSTTGLTNIPFAWDAVTGSTSYEFILSANADLSSPVVDQQNLAGTAFTYTGTLKAGPYYWQVNAYLNNAVKAKSVTGTFIAAPPATTAAPPPATSTVITFTQAPATTVTFTQPAPTTITIPAAEVTEITPAWIWGIIGIGAVLIIVVIVLIVRTRRSA